MKKALAFTLVECIAALLVTSLVVILMGLAMSNLRTVNRHSLAGSTDWIICLQELESTEHHFALKRVNRFELTLRDQQQKRDYELLARDRLYLRTTEGGYMPIFSGLRSAQTVFRRLDDRRVFIKVEKTNGQKLAGIVCFAPLEN